MVTYTKNQNVSYDFTQTRGTIHPCFSFSKVRKNISETGLHSACSYSEIASLIDITPHTGYVVVENNKECEIVAASGTPSEGGMLLVTASYVVLIYTSAVFFTVYTDEKLAMIPQFYDLLPTRVLMTPSSVMMGCNPSSYSFVEGGLIEVFESNDSARIPYCKYAFSSHGKLRAVFGLTTGSASMDFRPQGTKGMRMSILSTRRRQPGDAKEYPADEGVLIADASSMEEALDKFVSGSTCDLSFARLWKAPASLAGYISTSLSFLAYNTSELRELCDYFVSLSYGDTVDGSDVRDFVNGDDSAITYVQANTAALSDIERLSKEEYERVMAEEIKARKAVYNAILATIDDEEIRAKAEAGKVGLVDGLDLRQLPVPEMPVVSLIGDVDTIKDLNEEAIKRLNAFNGVLSFPDPEDPDGVIGYKENSILARVLGSANVPEYDGDEEEGYYPYLARLIGSKAREYLAPIMHDRSKGTVRLNGNALREDEIIKFSDISQVVVDEDGLTPIAYDYSALAKSLSASNAGTDHHHCSCGKTIHCDEAYVDISPEIQCGAYPHSGDSNTPSWSFPESAMAGLTSPAWVDSSYLYHSNGYDPKLCTALLGLNIDSFKFNSEARRDATVRVTARVAFRPLDMFGGERASSVIVEHFKNLLNIAMTKAGHPVEIEFAQTLPWRSTSDAKYNVTRTFYPGHDNLSAWRINKSVEAIGTEVALWSKMRLSCSDSVHERIERHFPYQYCDYAVFRLTFEIQVSNIPVVDFATEMGGSLFKEYQDKSAASARRHAADAAAIVLINELTRRGLLDQVDIVYDLDGYARRFAGVEDAQLLTNLKLSIEPAIVIVAKMLQLRDSKYLDDRIDGENGSYVVSRVGRNRIDNNIRNVCVACGINMPEVADVSEMSDDQVQARVREIFTNPENAAKSRHEPFWYIDSLALAADCGADENLAPYYGAIL